MSTSKGRAIDISDITPENITHFMEQSRVNYIENLKKVVSSSIMQGYAHVSIGTETIYAELEAGSKELSIYRELFYLVSKSVLSPDKWADIVKRLATLKEEQVAKAQKAQDDLSEVSGKPN